jgi:hypothetical protein
MRRLSIPTANNRYGAFFLPFFPLEEYFLFSGFHLRDTVLLFSGLQRARCFYRVPTHNEHGPELRALDPRVSFIECLRGTP